jgi:hypothetical protein
MGNLQLTGLGRWLAVGPKVHEAAGTRGRGEEVIGIKPARGVVSKHTRLASPRGLALSKVVAISARVGKVG